MDNATVASMQGTVGRTDAGSAPGIACQQMPLSFLKGGETGTIAKVRDDEGVCVAVVVDYDFCKGCGVCAKVCPVPCIAMVDEHAGENEGAAETAETLDETSPSSGVAGVSGVSTERVPQRREQDSMSCSPKRGLSERIEIPETPTGKGGLA